MGRTELPWLFLGRLVRPYSLAVSIAAGSLGVLITGGESRYGAGAWSHVVGLLAFICAGLLWAGWWSRSATLMQHGLILTAGVFATRATFMLLTRSPAAAMFMLAWSVGSGGAWLLEQTTGRDRVEAWSLRNGAGGGGSE